MDAFNKEIEELLAIQAQNSEALRKLSTELISLNFSLLVDEESLKKVLDSKEKSHALYCEQVMKLYKLKNEEAEHRKRIQEAISEIVPLQHRLEELEKCQERQNQIVQEELKRVSLHKARVYQWYLANHPNLFKPL